MATEPQPKNATPEAGPPPETSVAWAQIRTVLRIIGVILVVAALLWGLYQIEALLLLLIISIFFAYLISPIVTLARKLLGLKDTSQGRALAASVTYILMFAFVGGILYLVIPSVGQQITQFAQEAPTYISLLQTQTKSLDRFYTHYHIPAPTRQAVDTLIARSIQTGGNFLKTGAIEAVSWLVYLPWIVLVPIFAFFLLRDAQSLQLALLKLFPPGSPRWQGRGIFLEMHKTFTAYIRAQLVACLLVAILCTLGFWLIGLPYALVLGIAAGFLEFIPLAGPLTIMVIATILAAFSSGMMAVEVLLFLLLLRIAEDYIIYPRIIGMGIHMHPLATILAILAGAELAGIVGIFLSIPFVTLFSVAYRRWLEESGREGIVATLLKAEEPRPGTK